MGAGWIIDGAAELCRQASDAMELGLDAECVGAGSSVHAIRLLSCWRISFTSTEVSFTVACRASTSAISAATSAVSDV